MATWKQVSTYNTSNIFELSWQIPLIDFHQTFECKCNELELSELEKYCIATAIMNTLVKCAIYLFSVIKRSERAILSLENCRNLKSHENVIYNLMSL